MMRPSEIRVWSLIWPSRASRGSVRAVSTARVRTDLLAATTASAAAARQRQRRLGDLADAVREPRAQCDTAVGVLGGLIGHQVDAVGLVAAAGRATSPIRPPSASVCCAALDPTTRPKCPVRMRYS